MPHRPARSAASRDGYYPTPAPMPSSSTIDATTVSKYGRIASPHLIPHRIWFRCEQRNHVAESPRRRFLVVGSRQTTQRALRAKSKVLFANAERAVADSRAIQGRVHEALIDAILIATHINRRRPAARGESYSPRTDVRGVGSHDRHRRE